VQNHLKKLKFFKDHRLFIFILGVYLFVTLFSLLDVNHFLYNLEPYPDGILYALSGRNAILNRGFALISNYGHIQHWVLPMYSFVLGGGYLLFGVGINSFYITNVLLQVLGIIFLYLILRKTVNYQPSVLMGLAIYLSHIVIFWLPSLPMGENLILPLLLIIIYTFLEKNNHFSYGLLTISVISLLFTRYTTIGTVIAGLILFFFKSQQEQKIKNNNLPLTVLTILLIVFLAFFGFTEISIVKFVQEIINEGSPYFSLDFIIPNIVTYAKMLFASKGWFLWKNIGISNIIFSGLFFYSIYYFNKIKKHTQSNILLFFFLAQLPIQLIFYVADARYLVLVLPLIALGVVWLIDAWPEKRKILVPLAIVGIALQLFLQRSLVKEVIASNLLGSSTAWQYEAVLHFNNHLEEEALIITALPPFLVDVYQTTSYRVLPMSHDQEFLSKKQYVWGDDINYADLRGTYREWLEEGRELYISNAYITHQQSVIEDYESYKESFEFEIMAEGCDQACNIYRLSLK
jgi:hypothetical protein